MVFEVDGIRIGCALCVEVNFPPLFAEYERLDVDCVLLSVMVDDAPRARVAQAYGTPHSYWLGHSIPAQFSTTVPSGIVAPGGRWLAQCPPTGNPLWRSRTSTSTRLTRTSTWPSATPGRGAVRHRTGSTTTIGYQGIREATPTPLSEAAALSSRAFRRGPRPEAGLLQKPDLSGEVLALAGDAGVADAVAGPREEFRVEVGCGAGCRVRPGPRAAVMRIAGPDFSVRILA